MDARELLAGILAVCTAVLFLAFPHLFDLPLVRRLTKRLEAWLGLEPSDGRFFSSSGTRRWDAWLDCEPHGPRVFSPPGAVGTVGSLAGFVIEPGRGVGPVTFGLSPGQIEAVLGRPPPGAVEWDDGNLNDCLIYQGLRFGFDRHDSRGPLADSRMWLAEIRRADAVLFGRPLADWPVHELIGELTARGYRLKEHMPGYAAFASPHLGLWFDEGTVAVEIGAEPDD